MDSITELFCDVDDFCLGFLPEWQGKLLSQGVIRRRRSGQLHLSEIMTILIHFHQSHYRDFKAYYCQEVWGHLRSEFPHLVSYTRFVGLMPAALIPLCVYLRRCCLGQCSGISFLDATSLAVCHNRRISQHKVFAGLAARGQTSTGWFFGFKLHLVVNERGELLEVALTPGNVNDRKPVPQMVRHLFGKIFADKGYVSQPLFEELLQTFNIQLITRIRRNMQNRLVLLTDKLLLRKRAIIETIVDQLKNISQIEHARHRSPTNFLVNVICGLIAYAHQPKKPTLRYQLWLQAPA